MKTCPKCKEEKPFSAFNKNRSKKDGYQSYCKVCSCECYKSYYEKNKEKERERKSQYRQENKDLIRERERKYKQENKDRVREYSRKWCQENKDRVRGYYHKYHKNLPAGVYKITNTINGKIYVGESTGYPTRFNKHKNRLKRGVHENPGLQTDYDQHSLDVFDFQVIEEHPPDADKSLLVERERYFINKYKEEGKELYNAW